MNDIFGLIATVIFGLGTAIIGHPVPAALLAPGTFGGHRSQGCCLTPLPQCAHTWPATLLLLATVVTKARVTVRCPHTDTWAWATRPTQCQPLCCCCPVWPPVPLGPVAHHWWHISKPPPAAWVGPPMVASRACVAHQTGGCPGVAAHGHLPRGQATPCQWLKHLVHPLCHPWWPLGATLPPSTKLGSTFGGWLGTWLSSRLGRAKAGT